MNSEVANIKSVPEVVEAVARGDKQAAAELLPLLYKELRRLAVSRMAKLPPGNTLQPTALVHDAYLRLQDPRKADIVLHRYFAGLYCGAPYQGALRQGTLHHGAHRC